MSHARQRSKNIGRDSGPSPGPTLDDADFLDQPSPYHDTHDGGGMVQSEPRSMLPQSRLFSMNPSKLAQKYTRVSESADSDTEKQRQWSVDAENGRQDWLFPVFSLLLISSLLNLFLLFGGDITLSCPSHHDHTHVSSSIKGDLFGVQGIHETRAGKNWTCYQTHEQQAFHH
ncbi:hypothetical protein LTS18_012542 [Coniosporium uncinatum]|uniref:Uncharacterized protein n=1 Tax=Coniosporium uncinatum TaxID=93489 RepID=A0ACC3CXC7_9PEZI|nr:hypothetical protein LTS18_012542 [Coniosporium uncinatum]